MTTLSSSLQHLLDEILAEYYSLPNTKPEASDFASTQSLSTTKPLHEHDHARTSAATSQRIMVALVGIPAAGKTTAAKALCHLINSHIRARSIAQTSSQASDPTQPETSSSCPSGEARDEDKFDDVCVVVPMDGYHLTRAQLSASPNAEELFARRGAHWTFDAIGLGEALQRVKSGFGHEVRMHGWSHALKDPSYDAVVIPAHARIVIVEGLYLLLDVEPWSTYVRPIFSKRILLKCDPELAAQRGTVRNWKAGICDSLEASIERWAANDNVNAQFILDHLDPSTLTATLTQQDLEPIIAGYLSDTG